MTAGLQLLNLFGFRKGKMLVRSVKVLKVFIYTTNFRSPDLRSTFMFWREERKGEHRFFKPNCRAVGLAAGFHWSLDPAEEAWCRHPVAPEAVADARDAIRRRWTVGRPSAATKMGPVHCSNFPDGRTSAEAVWQPKIRREPANLRGRVA